MSDPVFKILAADLRELADQVEGGRWKSVEVTRDWDWVTRNTVLTPERSYRVYRGEDWHIRLRV